MKFLQNLTETEQNQLIEQSKTMQSRTEMRKFCAAFITAARWFLMGAEYYLKMMI